MQAKSLTGANLKIFINGRLFGIGTASEWHADYGRKTIFGIDSYLPQEIASGQVTVNGSIDCIRTKLSGGLEGAGIAANDQNILLEKYIRITLIDRQTDTTIFNCFNALVSSQSWKASSGSIMRGSFSFIGTNWSNEVT
jgi:hypothetical protein